MTSLTTSGLKFQRKQTVENAASNGFRWNFSRTIYTRITGSTNLPDMTSLVTLGQLQNAIKCCRKVMRKTGPASQTHIFRPLFNPDPLRKTAENAASDGFGSNFSGTAFCLPHQFLNISLCYLAGGSKSISIRPPVRPGHDDHLRL